MKRIIQHSESSAQSPTRKRAGLTGGPLLEVGRGIFSLLVVSVWPLHGQPNALPPLSPPYGELQPTFWEQYHAAVIIGGIAMILLTAFLIWWSLRSKPVPVPPPAKIARDALEPLRIQAEDGSLLSAVSQILRRYIGAVLHFSGSGMTTAEFTATMTGTFKLDPQFTSVLSDLLDACDKDKFVAHRKAPPLNAVERALQLIDLVERSEAQLKATGGSKP